MSSFMGDGGALLTRHSRPLRAMSEFRSDGSKLNINEIGGGKDRENQIEAKIAKFKAEKIKKARGAASEDSFGALFDFDTGKRVPAQSKTQGSAAQVKATREALEALEKEMRGGASKNKDPGAGMLAEAEAAEDFFNRGPKMKRFVKPTAEE